MVFYYLLSLLTLIVPNHLIKYISYAICLLSFSGCKDHQLINNVKVFSTLKKITVETPKNNAISFKEFISRKRSLSANQKITFKNAKTKDLKDIKLTIYTDCSINNSRFTKTTKKILNTNTIAISDLLPKEVLLANKKITPPVCQFLFKAFNTKTKEPINLLSMFQVFNNTNQHKQTIPIKVSSPTDTVSTQISNNQNQWQEQLSFIHATPSSQEAKWWLSYKQTLQLEHTNTSQFCVNIHPFTQLNPFPLKDHARLYYYYHCEELASLELSSYPLFLRKKAARMWLKKAHNLQSDTEIMLASFYLHKLSVDKHQKEKHLTTALQYARKLNDFHFSKWQKRFYKLAPRFISKPAPRQILPIAHDFRRVRQFKQAIKYYRQLLNTKGTPFKEKHLAFKWLRWIYKDQQKKSKYLKATVQWQSFLERNIPKQKEAIKLYHNVSSLLARTQWTLGKTHQALATLEQTRKVLKGRFSLFEVYRLKGHILKDLGQMQKALSFFRKALKETNADADMKDKTWWQLAWILNQNKQYEESLEVLQDLFKNTENDYLKSRVLFWIGQLQEKIGQKQKATKSYQKLIALDPFYYYGLLAHHQLKIPIQINKSKHLSIQGSNKQYDIARWLISLEQYDEAQNFLKYQFRLYQKDKSKKIDQWIDLFYYMTLSNMHLQVFQSAGRMPLHERSMFFKSYTSLLFPIAYQKEVEQAEQLFNIEKELIYALIRQESAFNPKARSPSDAFGLMQVRPATAKQIAKSQGIRYHRTKDLYDPKTNILIGTAFLKKQFARSHFQFIITLSAYNAGRTAVNRWLKQKKATDPLSFIEEIPFEETRIYVTLLIRNFVFYKLMTHPKRSIYFPDWVLHFTKQNV